MSGASVTGVPQPLPGLYGRAHNAYVLAPGVHSVQNATACPLALPTSFGCTPVSVFIACEPSPVSSRVALPQPPRRAPHFVAARAGRAVVIQVASALPLASMVTLGWPSGPLPSTAAAFDQPACGCVVRRLSARRSSRRSSRHRATSGRKVSQACSATTTTRRRSWRHRRRRRRTARARLP